jgi:hypothetical protein
VLTTYDIKYLLAIFIAIDIKKIMCIINNINNNIYIIDYFINIIDNFNFAIRNEHKEEHINGNYELSADEAKHSEVRR